jgi:hypothetical protein
MKFLRPLLFKFVLTRVHSWLQFSAVFALLCVSALKSPSATVTGNLTDISLSPLNTKLIFTPTNEVQIGGAGLVAGPPKILDTTAGAFSITLDSGDYTVSLPAIPYRRPFLISVFATNGTINITNIISALPPVPANANYTARALDNANIHIGTDGSCGFALLGTPFHINAAGNFDRLSVGDEGEHVLNGDGSFALANSNITGDTSGNLSAASFITAGDIEITDASKGVILKSPGGSRYRIKVADDGSLSTILVP